jgi:Dynamin family
LNDSGSNADRDAGERLAALAPPFLDAYGALRELHPLLARAPERLSHPVQLAVVGQIKKGKSTLVNAILGRRLAVTREEEATYRVNEFRFGTDEGISAYYSDGPGGSFRVREFPLDSLGRLTVHDPDRIGELLTPARIVVRVWEERLQRLTLIDTPGLHSVHGADADETQRLLEGRSTAAMDAADAILYLFDREIGGPDVDVVRAFLGSGSSARLANAAKAVGVMSRCDLNWRAGRAASEDPIAEGARRIRSRYDHEPDLRRTFYEIVPVAALAAEGALCLSPADLAELRSLGRWDPARLLDALKYPRSASFRKKLSGCPIPPDRCVLFKDQLGPWGLFQAFSLMRDNCTDATVVTTLVEMSGVARVWELVSSLYEHQRYVIKLNGLLDQLRRVLADQEHAGLPSTEARRLLDEVRDVVESITDNQPGLAEMQMTRLVRQSHVELDSEDAERITRLAELHRGIAGRLGRPGKSAPPELLAAARAEVRYWRAARYAGRSKETRDVVRSAVHVAENLAARLDTVVRLQAKSEELARRASALMAE